MHKTNTAGYVEYSECDFCAGRADDQVTVEGHQGSLICLKCLSVAYAEVVGAGLAAALAPGEKCVMCLEERSQPHWSSPVRDGRHICLRCIKQSATVLEKDAELGWKRPAGPAVDDGIG
jgi:hypothetical protein